MGTAQEVLCRATIEYDGTDYHGFQIQVGVPTIQGVLEQALRRLTQRETRVIGAGRTDAGVHASGQVIGFRAVWKHPLADLQRALNAVLPDDIGVLDLSEALAGFHPRFSAKGRRYRYVVFNRPVRSPLMARFTGHVSEPLDVEALGEAVPYVVGRHDFAAFGTPPNGGHTVRQVHWARWRRVDEDVLHFEVEANAFLRKMVRTLVGTMLEVGKGWRTPASLGAILVSRDRSQAAPPAPACGLCLIEVLY